MRLYLLYAVFTAGQLCWASEVQPEASGRKDICAQAEVERLTSSSVTNRYEALDALEKDRFATIRRLMEILDDRDKNPATQPGAREAIVLLGKYRAAEACSLLVRNIECTPLSYEGVSERTPLMHYPAAEALTRIGLPAQNAVLYAIRRGATQQQTRIYAFVLHRLDGKELAIARLELEIARAKDETAKKHLRAFLADFQKIDFASMPQWPRPPAK